MQRVRRIGFRKGVHYLEHGNFIRAWIRSTALTMLPRLLRRKTLLPQMKRKPSRSSALIILIGDGVPTVLRDVAASLDTQQPRAVRAAVYPQFRSTIASLATRAMSRLRPRQRPNLGRLRFSLYVTTGAKRYLHILFL